MNCVTPPRRSVSRTRCHWCFGQTKLSRRSLSLESPRLVGGPSVRTTASATRSAGTTRRWALCRRVRCVASQSSRRRARIRSPRLLTASVRPTTRGRPFTVHFPVAGFLSAAKSGCWKAPSGVGQAPRTNRKRNPGVVMVRPRPRSRKPRASTTCCSPCLGETSSQR